MTNTISTEDLTIARLHARLIKVVNNPQFSPQAQFAASQALEKIEGFKRGYVLQRVQQLVSTRSESTAEDLLYRIGSHVDLLTPEEYGPMDWERCDRVLNWLYQQAFLVESQVKAISALLSQ